MTSDVLPPLALPPLALLAPILIERDELQATLADATLPAAPARRQEASLDLMVPHAFHHAVDESLYERYAAVQPPDTGLRAGSVAPYSGPGRGLIPLSSR